MFAVVYVAQLRVRVPHSRRSVSAARGASLSVADAFAFAAAVRVSEKGVAVCGTHATATPPAAAAATTTTGGEGE